MKEITEMNNPYNDDKVIDACSIFGVMDTSGRKFSGEGVIRAIANMHIRGNGLGGAEENTTMAADAVLFMTSHLVIFSIIVVRVKGALVDAHLTLDTLLRVSLY